MERAKEKGAIVPVVAKHLSERELFDRAAASESLREDKRRGRFMVFSHIR